MPELHRAYKAAMLQWVAHIAALVANPVNALAVRVGLGGRFVQSRFAGGIDLLDAALFLLGLFLGQLALPAHLLGDLLLGFVGVAVFIEQFRVFVGARVALFHELLVIVLVPFLLGVFLSALLLLDSLGELPHEIVHARGGLPGEAHRGCRAA